MYPRKVIQILKSESQVFLNTQSVKIYHGYFGSYKSSMTIKSSTVWTQPPALSFNWKHRCQMPTSICLFWTFFLSLTRHCIAQLQWVIRFKGLTPSSPLCIFCREAKQPGSQQMSKSPKPFVMTSLTNQRKSLSKALKSLNKSTWCFSFLNLLFYHLPSISKPDVLFEGYYVLF